MNSNDQASGDFYLATEIRAFQIDTANGLPRPMSISSPS